MYRGALTLIGTTVCLLIVSGLLHVSDAEQTPAEQLADEIFHALGVQDSLIIHLNYGGGALTAALGVSDGFFD